ncbi:MAG: ribosome maturation factor RimM [Candidatus Eremiobacteraeota bacterium]|nr:ribosome maturation factor RimM [Candidatus Eremiobacteraeota bacterium]
MEGNRNKECLITIGKIIKPFGIRGEVQVEILTDFPHRFFEMESLFLVREKQNSPILIVNIESARLHKKRALLKLDVINSIEDAELYRNSYLKISKDDLMELEDDEFYIFDVIGLEVLTVEGTNVGKVVKVIPAGYHDVYEVMHPVTGKVNLIPACKQFVKEVNLESRKIIIEPIEELIDL